MDGMNGEIEAVLNQLLLCPEGELEYLLANSNDTSLFEALQELYSSNSRDKEERPDDAVNPYRRAEDFLNSVVVTLICALGMMGNIINLAILSHRSWQIALGRMERFSHAGLIGLAASDLLFCLSVIPHSFVKQHGIGYNTLGFHAIYLAYCNAVINTCLLCSTMLTVALAVGRYFGIVYPIRARELIGMTFTRRVIGSVILFSIVANLPRYWSREIRTVYCYDDSRHYVIQDGPIKDHLKLYLSIYFVIAMCIPFVVLTFCNVYLLKTLKQTFEAPIQCRPKERSRDSSFRITLSLVIIIIAFLVLVIPGEVINFFMTVLLEPNGNPDKYNLSVAVLSCLQAINFSFNFVLYCSVNTHFRRTVKSMIRCHWTSISQRNQGSFRYDSVSMDGSNTMRMSITMGTKGQYMSTTDNTDPMSVGLLNAKTQNATEHSEPIKL